MRRGGGGQVCESRETRLSAEIQPQAGGKSILSAKVVVWLWNKGTERTEGVSSEGKKKKKKKISASSLFLPDWLERGAWML